MSYQTFVNEKFRSYCEYDRKYHIQISMAYKFDPSINDVVPLIYTGCCELCRKNDVVYNIITTRRGYEMCEYCKDYYRKIYGSFKIVLIE